MVWFYLSAGSVFFFTSMYLLQRILAVESKNPRAMAVAFNSIAACLALVLFVISGGVAKFHLPNSPEAFVFLGIASLGYGMFERLRFVFSKLLDASVFSVISTIGMITAFTSSTLLYREPVMATKMVGVFLILIALTVISYQKNSKASKRGIFLCTLATLILGIAWSLDKKGAIYFQPDTYNILVWTIPLVVIIFPSIKLSAVVHEIRSSSWNIVLLSGANVAGYFLQLKALALAEATRVIPIVQTATLFTVLFGIVFLNEREEIPKKVLAGIIAIAGVYLLV